MLGTDSVRPSDETTGDDATDWAIPADWFAAREVDPWLAVSDERADENEERFQYPAGLP